MLVQKIASSRVSGTTSSIGVIRLIFSVIPNYAIHTRMGNILMAIHQCRISGKSCLLLLLIAIPAKSGYIRCHGGDIYYTFGTLIKNGLPLRDDIDLPFMQLTVDQFTSFARTYNPNPDVEFLRSRNYLSTLSHQQSPAGIWEPVNSGANSIRVLDWPGQQQPFKDTTQCGSIGLSLDYYA